MSYRVNDLLARGTLSPDRFLAVTAFVFKQDVEPVDLTVAVGACSDPGRVLR